MHTGAVTMASLAMGCVTFNHDFFNHFPYQESAFAQAKVRVDEQLSDHKQALLALEWQGVAGASGAVQSVLEVLAEQAQSERQQWFDLDMLYQLKSQVLASSCSELSDIAGLNAERAPTFVSGVAILIALSEKTIA